MTAAAAQASADRAVYTYGWDTAFAIPVPCVNKAIVDHKSSPAGFAMAETSYSVSARFGDWQITQGGDGKAVRMRLPLSDVQLTFTTTGKLLQFQDGHATVELELHYVPHDGPGADASTGGTPMALKANPTSNDPDRPVLSVIDLVLSPTPGTVAGALIQQALADWGSANLAEFAHVFSVVDLNRMVDQGQWGFVTPHYTSYAYLDGDTLDTSTFAVLCMTGDRDGSQLSEQISEAAIPPTTVAGFVVSQVRALVDLVRPAIIQAYPGLTNDNFLLNDDQTQLYLTSGTQVALPPVTQSGSVYYPQLENLTVESLGQVITLTSYTTTAVAAGITAWCTTVHQYTVTLAGSSNGQTLAFTSVGQPSIIHGITQSPGSQLTQLIIDIVAGVALLLLVILTDGAALVIGGLVLGLIIGADQLVPALIKKLNTDDSPAIDLMLVNAVDPIKWTASRDFKLQYASLNASLQLGGDPLFV
jgi:hypothetical protein